MVKHFDLIMFLWRWETVEGTAGSDVGGHEARSPRTHRIRFMNADFPNGECPSFFLPAACGRRPVPSQRIFTPLARLPTSNRAPRISPGAFRPSSHAFSDSCRRLCEVPGLEVLIRARGIGHLLYCSCCRYAQAFNREPGANPGLPRSGKQERKPHQALA